jgi:hypothetical protein
MDGDFHKVLYDYLEKTDSRMLLPDIVFQELPVVYKRRLLEEHGKLRKHRGVFQSLLLSPGEAEARIDFDGEVAAFLANIVAIFSKYEKSFRVAHPPAILDALISRSVNRVRPFSEGRDEFRDTLLWLAVLDVGQKQHEKNVVFISDNRTDFCDGAGKLHGELLQEAATNGVEVHYYRSISDFVQSHAQEIAEIDEARVLEIMSQVETEPHLLKSLRTDYLPALQRRLERRYDIAENLQVVDSFLMIDKYSVYEMRDNEKLLMVTLSATATVLFEALADEDPGWSSRMRDYERELECEAVLKYWLNSKYEVTNWDVEQFDVL